MRVIRKLLNVDSRLPDEGTIQSGFRYAFSLCRDHHDAEDFVQQACLRLCRRYGRIKSRTLLFTAIRNLYFDRCRRDKIVQFASLEEGGTNLQCEKSGAGQLNEMDLEAALDELDPSSRELVYLHLIEGYTASEVAKITSKPRGTVLSKLGRAKKQLVDFFEADQARAQDKRRKETI